MLKIFGLIAAYLTIISLDFPSILNQKEDKLKYLIIYSFVIIIGFVMGILQIVKKIPQSPNKMIESIVKSFM